MTVHVEVVKSIKNVVEDNFGGPKCEIYKSIEVVWSV